MDTDKLGTYKTMVLSMLIDNNMSKKQIDYIVGWVKDNFSPVHFEKLAEIAWQYNADELQNKLLQLVDKV